MKLLTASLEGKALDWALAKATRQEVAIAYGGGIAVRLACGGWFDFEGHADPALCLGLMEKHRANVQHDLPIGGDVIVSIYAKDERIGWGQGGDTIAQAVARCVVAMQLGDEVEVPDELCGVQS